MPTTRQRRPPRQPKDVQRTKRGDARVMSIRLAKRIRAGSGCAYQDIADELGVHERVAEHLFNESARHHLRFSDVIALGQGPNTAEFARRLLLAALATLDTHQLRACDLERMASSPVPADREIVVNVLRPLAEQLGLVPHAVVNTAEVANAVVYEETPTGHVDEKPNLPEAATSAAESLIVPATPRRVRESTDRKHANWRCDDCRLPKLRCGECLDARRTYQRKQALAKRKAGICLACQAPSEAGARYCQVHLDYMHLHRTTPKI